MKELNKAPANVLLETLHRACSVKRPADGVGEAKLAAYMAVEFGATLIDGAGNIHFDRRTNGERTLWTAHLDSVHHHEGPNTIEQDGRFWRASGDVLGADDGAGVALIARMLSKGVSGYFCLFRSEETGGQGSKWLADNMPDLLLQFGRAIAFDRAGYYDVITHQAGVRCCSDEFADALAQQLSFEESGLMFMPSDDGVYTDTAEFTSLIPECTNLSVGYFHQHSANEYQNVEFLQQLAEVLCLVDWEALPTSRDPAEKEDLWAGWEQPRDAALFVEPILGPEEQALLEALSSALTENSLAPVLQQVRELLNDYENVYKSSALKETVLDDCISALLGGFTAYDVALDLQELMIN